MSERKIVNLDYLDREAALYKQAKSNIKENAKVLQETIDKHTKEEVDAIQKAIKNLNEKVDRIMKTDFVKEKTQIIEHAEKQMMNSIKSAADTFFKVSKIINEKEGLTPEMKKQYQDKLYNKILDKFMTKEEKELFNKLVNSGPIMILGGNQMLGGESLPMLQGGF
jgi:hypothetical protein